MTARIDRYKLKRLLGQGAMGKVYLAIDPKLDREVAIKVLLPAASDEDLRRRFRLEAKAIAALKHPNIVELYDYSGQEAPDLFVVMEYVPGPSLYTLCTDRGPMSEPTALAIGHELALALAHAHEHQIVHRDLKPDNVLLHQGRVVLTDFGIAKAFARDNALGTEPEIRTQVLGTPGFMAPEQFRGTGLDPRTDIWALGAVLYNLTTNRLPFASKNLDDTLRRARRGKLSDPRQFNPTLTEEFCQFLSHCMQPKQKSRPAGAVEVRDHVLALLAKHGVTEIRQELVGYENNPVRYADELRERSIDVLVRDLKVALKDKNEAEAQEIIVRMQVLAPVDERISDITGVSFDAQHRPVFTRREQSRKRIVWLAVGVAVGTLVGVACTAAAVALRLIPPIWVETLSRMGDSGG